MIAIKNLKKLRSVPWHKNIGVLQKLCCSVPVSFSSSSLSNSPKVENIPHLNVTLIDKTFGQPTAHTHPHLISKGCLVPEISVEEFKSRRTRLMEGIQKYARENGELSANHLIIIPSATKKYMSDKIPYVFRQNSDFYYLTGCLEVDSVLVLFIDEHSITKSLLFLRPKDKHAELWDGARTGPEAGIELFGVEESYATDQFSKQMASFLKSYKPEVWYDSKSSELSNITQDVSKLMVPLTILKSPDEFVQSMRLFKSPSEQTLMRKTCQIASNAINTVMHSSRPGHSEHQLFAMVDYQCRMSNASHLAYPPVVASGNNATTIHYINNTQITKTGDLVLMDAGCEYGGYSSDITRTWPISGTFTEPQRVLYDVISQVQTELLGTILKDGGDTLDNLFDTMCIKLGKYLQEISLVPKSISDIQGLAKAGFKFCPHHVSHYLGMDVHDTPLMPRNLRLLPGMVFTVEPGIYIGLDRTDVPKEFRGLGIRIEDDVLIRYDGKVENLTESCIKNRSELENFR